MRIMILIQPGAGWLFSGTIAKRMCCNFQGGWLVT
jgi:hypothetical protein